MAGSHGLLAASGISGFQMFWRHLCTCSTRRCTLLSRQSTISRRGNTRGSALPDSGPPVFSEEFEKRWGAVPAASDAPARRVSSPVGNAPAAFLRYGSNGRLPKPTGLRLCAADDLRMGSTAAGRNGPAKRKASASLEEGAPRPPPRPDASASARSTPMDDHEIPDDFFFGIDDDGDFPYLTGDENRNPTPKMIDDNILSVYIAGALVDEHDRLIIKPDEQEADDDLEPFDQEKDEDIMSPASAAVKPEQDHDALKIEPKQEDETSTLLISTDPAPSGSGTLAPGPTPTEAGAEPPLCPEQARAVQLVLEGRNLFLTGSAGCGKSTVVKAFTRRLKALGKTVDIVAPTGIAALAVNGTTVHAYAGLSPAHDKLPLLKLRGYAVGNKKIRKRLKLTDVLVIDEISMVENFFFERLNAMLQSARGVGAPFGGVQVVVTGDFFQLPPVLPFEHCIKCGSETIVNRKEDSYACESCKERPIWYDEDKWAFKSTAWEDCHFVYCELETVHRQNDETFVRILQKIRLGTPLTTGEEDLLLDPSHAARKTTELYPTRDEVRQVNQANFDQLQTEKYSYTCLDDVNRDDAQYPHLKEIERRLPDRSLSVLSKHRFERVVELKKGMIVILLANLDLKRGLCNGTQGIIVDFEAYDTSKLLRAKGLERRLTVQELSSPDGKEKERQVVLKETKVREFMGRREIEKKVWPVVHFHNGERRTVFAECSIEQRGDKQPYILLSRTQIPLMPGWASTIHKSQGRTLDQGKVNLNKSWEDGQVYVACSRVKTLKGLRIEGGRDGLAKASANPEVKKFYQQHFLKNIKDENGH